MTYRQFAAIMGLATVLCWLAWIFVLINVDPFFASAGSFAFFYATLFATLFGSFSVLFCTVYYFFSDPDVPMYRYVKQSFLFAAVFSIIIVAVLFLKANRLLTMWTVSFLILALCLGLIYSLGQNKKSQHNQTV